MKLRDHLDFAVESAYEAGRSTLKHFDTGVGVEVKEDDTPVTVADREAEWLLRERIANRYPGHAIVGEEYGEEGEGSHRWILDPIDGTKAFIRGVPLYGTLLALEVDGRCEIGVAYFPALDEMVYAASGKGCYRNGRRCRVADTDRLDRSIFSFTDGASFEEYGRGEVWRRLQQATYYSAGWSDAYGHALVATGRLEIMLDPIMNLWDGAPFGPILREAGGFFGSWSGEETVYAGEGLSTTRTLLPQVLDLTGDR